MGDRTVDLGKYKRKSEEVEREKTALLSLLRQLSIDGIECEFEDTILVNGMIHVFAHINWNEPNDIKDLRIGRQIDNVIEQIGN